MRRSKLEEVIGRNTPAGFSFMSPQVPASWITDPFPVLDCCFSKHLQMFLVEHPQPQIAEKSET